MPYTAKGLEIVMNDLTDETTITKSKEFVNYQIPPLRPSSFPSFRFLHRTRAMDKKFVSENAEVNIFAS